MNESKVWNGDVSNLLNNIYRCANRNNWYSNVVQAYDHTRPRYPDAMIARMQQSACLQTPKVLLEIGAGPGIASVELAKLGLSMLCLEPSLAACKLAQEKCKAYPQVKFINTTFEEWELTPKKFDAIIAATSFHWVAPGIRTQKTAAALKDDGSLILLWNTPPQTSYEVFQSIADIYQVHAPELANYESLQGYHKSLGKMGQELIDSGYFTNLVEEQLVNEVTYSVDDYLTLLSTLSPYIRLKAQQRDDLFVELSKNLKLNHGDQLELSYLSMLQIARKN